MSTDETETRKPADVISITSRDVIERGPEPEPTAFERAAHSMRQSANSLAEDVDRLEVVVFDLAGDLMTGDEHEDDWKELQKIVACLRTEVTGQMSEAKRAAKQARRDATLERILRARFMAEVDKGGAS